MGAKYTTTTVTGYNSSPPPDDNTRGADNQLSWDKHKSKLGDPVKSAIESINTKLVNMDNTSALTKSADYPIVAADNNKTIHVTGTTTLTLDQASSLGDGFRIVIVKTEAANTVTIATSASQLINGKSNRTLTTLNESVTISCNGSTFYIESDTGHESSPINVVTDYGANNAGAGAGATNAHTEINLAITEAAASSTIGTVFLPAGTYDIGASINMAPGVKLLGEGPGITVLRATANSISMIDYLLSGSTTPFFNIENMSITSDDHFTVTGIEIAGASTSIRCADVRIESLYITGGAVTEMAKGIKLELCANSTIEDVFCTECFRGIEVEMCTDTDLTNIKIQNGAGAGLYLVGDNTATSFDEGMRITGCSTNGQVIGVTATGMDFVNISNSSFTTCDSGPLIGAFCRNWSLTGSEFAEAGASPNTAGVQMDDDCLNWTIIGNYIFSNEWGLDLDGGYHVVTSNIFQDNDSNDIIVAATANHCIVNNNICRSDVTTSIHESNGSDYNQISHNICNGGIGLPAPLNNSVVEDNLEDY